MVEGLPNMKFKESRCTKRMQKMLFPIQLIMEKSEIGCKRNRRAKRQSITVRKMPLGACMQALREGKPMKVPFHKNRQG